MKKSVKTAFWYVGVSLWVLVPLAVGGAAVYVDEHRQVSAEAAIWVHPAAVEGSVARNVALVYEWSNQNSVIAPAWSGVVQKTNCRPGTTLAHGDVLATVDGLDRILAHTAMPFARSLGVNDVGEDVTMLNGLLGDLGFRSGDGNRFDWNTRIGVQEWSAQLSISGEPSDIFDPSWIVFLPSDSITVSTCSLEVATAAPPAGALVAAGAATVQRARVAQASVLDRFAVEIDPATSFSVSDDEIVEVPSDASVVVNGQEVPFDLTKQEVLPSGLDLISANVNSGVAATPAMIMTPRPAGAMRVPIAAIIVDSRDRTCVLAAAEADRDAHAIIVEVVGQQSGDAVIRGDIDTDDRIQVAAQRDGMSCGS